MKGILSSVAFGLLFSSNAFATPVTPSFTTFGTLPAATFGGSGIPNDAVAIRTINDGGATITLGLTAHQRYSNPALANNNAGIFSAGAGANFGDPNFGPPPSSTLGATWNFAWYVSVSEGSFSDYTFKLLYDFDPGAGTEQAALGAINLNSIYVSPQDTQNLLFDYLDGNTINGSLASLFSITAPPSGSFNPNAAGEYSFALIASKNGSELDRSAILVNTTAAVPDTASTGLLSLLGFRGILFFAAWQRRSPSHN